MEVLSEGILPGLYLAILLLTMRFAVKRMRFQSENILDIRDPQGGSTMLRLDLLEDEPPAQRQQKIEKAVAELAA